MKLSTKIRIAAGLDKSSRYPVEIVRGDNKPRLTGKPHHYKTKGGKTIFYPSAYRKNGWSNMVYIPSTLRVEVGDAWILEQKI